ncbi:hypothetical protein C0991_001071 [Blastosporella zonata]|nr:hypothetical protein C0991_001071 [Blastosporella zonata]
MLTMMWYKARQLRLYGIGKGGQQQSPSFQFTLPNNLTAPGFQTNVRRVRVTPEIAARIRRGENVSPDEIARAAKEAEEREPPPSPPPFNSLAGRGVVEEVQLQQETETEREERERNEWLPESITTPKKRSKGKKR